MTRDDIIKLAREAGAVPHSKDAFGDPTGFSVGVSNFERFAVLVTEHKRKSCALHYHDITLKAIEEEREAIAQMFEAAPTLLADVRSNEGGCLICGFTPRLAAAAIRARSNHA